MESGLDGYSGNDVLSPCRTCFENVGTRPIWGGLDSPDISLELTTIGGVHLQPNDDLPQLICEDCFKFVETAVVFRQSAKRSESFFKRRIGTIRKKQDNMQLSSIVQLEAEKKNIAEPDIKFVSIKDEAEPVETTEIIYYESKESETEISTAELSLDETEIEVIEETVDFEDAFEYNENYELQDSNDNGTVKLNVPDEKAQTRRKYNNYCKLCHLEFNSKYDLDEHRETKEHKRRYVMSFFPKKRKKHADLNQEGEKETKTVNPKDHSCKICNRMFTKLHYPRHMQSKHNVVVITSRSNMKKECPICKKMFHPVALNRHIKRIHAEKEDKTANVKIECPVCKKLFSKDFYSTHIQGHTGYKNYVCDQCGKKFFFRSVFHNHRLTHTNVLPHKCAYCPYKGRTKSLLSIHVRTHTGDYPYKCTQCETRCITKSNLNAHMQRHRGPVDFTCETCNRGFYTKLELEKHVTVIHLGIKNHVCNMCGMAFGYRHGLTAHQVKVHKRAKTEGKAKAVYLKLEEEGLLQPEKTNCY